MIAMSILFQSDFSGCIDIIFVARQLIEKPYEHEGSPIVISVDVKKEYDSLSQEPMQQILDKCGFPPSIFMSIHVYA